MPHQVRVLIRLPETAQQTPIENGNGHVFGWTQQVGDLGYCYEFASVDEFNRRAKELFETMRPPGHQYVPYVAVECGADEQPSDRLALLEETNAALQGQIDKLTLERDQLSEQLTVLARENSRLLDELTKPAEVLTPPAAEVPGSPPAQDVGEGPHVGITPETAPPPYPWAEKIDEKLAIQAHRLNQLAQALEVLPQDLRAFIESKGSGYYIDPKGAWVKKTPVAE